MAIPTFLRDVFLSSFQNCWHFFSPSIQTIHCSMRHKRRSESCCAKEHRLEITQVRILFVAICQASSDWHSSKDDICRCLSHLSSLHLSYDVDCCICLCTFDSYIWQRMLILLPTMAELLLKTYQVLIHTYYFANMIIQFCGSYI